MEIIALDGLPAHDVNRFGSNGFRVAGLGTFGEARVSVLSLGPGGVIGRHPAVGHQLFVIMTGTAEVSGEEGATATIGPGQAALWSPDESHETRSEHGMTALVLEGELTLEH